MLLEYKRVLVTGGAGFIHQYLTEDYKDKIRALRLATEKIFGCLDFHADEINYMTDKPVGVSQLDTDTTRAEELLGWDSQYTVESKNALDWYVENREPCYVRKIPKLFCRTCSTQA